MTAPDPFAPELAPALLAWWDVHGRKDLPWQRDPTPYRVWVSEIMLQQTQVATVTRYYDAFLAAFPTVVALADSAPDPVLHRWSGLGYYARARNLHKAARIVRDEHGGEVPRDFAALAALPGIGRSTAGAILALATGQRHPILDGNVKRVLARVFQVEGHPGEPAVARRLWALAEACTPDQRVGAWTQAIMDLGATLCARRKPACDACPLAGGCRSRAAGDPARLPGRKPAPPRPRRETVLVLALRDDGAVLLERRPEAGLWGGLWGLPEAADLDGVARWCDLHMAGPPAATRVGPKLRHGFTHFDLDITPVAVRLPARPDPSLSRAMDGDRWLWYKKSEPAAVGLAAPVARLIASLGDPSWPAP